MMTSPRIEERREQAYASIRARVTMAEMGTVVPPLWPEVFAWLEQRGVEPAGAPILRYLDVDMTGELEVEACVPVAVPVTGADRVRPGTLPGGRYASLVHTGDPDGLIGANRALQDWCRERGLTWPMDGERWEGRIEIYRTDPGQQPDRSRWETEVAYLVTGEPRG
jgi:effector-binding domain-containing protein